MASGDRVYPVPIFYTDDDELDNPQGLSIAHGDRTDRNRRGSSRGRERYGSDNPNDNARGRGRSRGRSRGRGTGRGNSHYKGYELEDTEDTQKIHRRYTAETFDSENADAHFGNSRGRGRSRGRTRGPGSGRGTDYYREHNYEGNYIADTDELPRKAFQRERGRARGRGGSYVRPKIYNAGDQTDRNTNSGRERRNERPERDRGRGRDRLRSCHSETALNQFGLNKTLDSDARRKSSKDFNAGGENRDRQSKKEFSLGYKKLTELSQMTDADELVLKISNSRGGFVQCLEKQLKPDWLHRILEIFSIAVKAQTCVSILRDLLHTIEDNFLQRLSSLFGQCMIDTEDLINDEKQFMNICLLTVSFLKSYMSLLQSSLGKCYPLIVMVKQVINKYNLTDDNLAKELAELDLVTDTIKEERIKLRQQQTRASERNKAIVFDENSEPPESFRELSILPSLEDLDSEKQPFLRPNVEVGKFKDLDHFLDIQFRLLREDYIRPLREGIRDYKAGITAGISLKKIKDIRLYRNVQVLRPVCTRSGIWYELQFDSEPFQKVNWSVSKRLLHGSLVCLSTDEFETVVFATVKNRDPKDLSNGQIQVVFDNRAVVKQNTTYIMAETTAFFEAYSHVLEGLHEIKQPMSLQRYIVDCETDINRPKYLDGQDIPIYDFTCILPKSAVPKRFPVLRTKCWPSEEELFFDASQMDAMKMALTKEIALIQGPPGTGKTYVGLKVAKMLLANEQYWKGAGKAACPILVVCYTNHALDQFLEGIHSFCRAEIVRVGGQSKNPTLEPFLLKNIRMKNRKEKKRPVGVHLGERDVLDQLYRNKTYIENASNKIKSTSTKIAPILSEEYVEKVIALSHYEAIRDRVSYFHQQNALEIWLGVTTEEEEAKIDSLEKLPETIKHYKIWKDLILNNIAPLAHEEATAVKDILKLSLHNRAQLYAAWLAEAIERLETTLGNLTTDNQLQKAKIEQQLNQMKMNILEINALQALPLSPRVKAQIDQLHQLKHKQKSVNRQVTAWLCLDYSKKSTQSIKAIIEKIPADATNFQKDDDLLEERRLDDEDDDFITDYKSQKTEKLDETEWITVHRDRKIGPKLRKILSKAPTISDEDVEQISDVWNITAEQKYELYRHWVRKYRGMLRQNIILYEGEFEKAAKKLKEIMDLENLEILRDASVVGMTTTGAAKNRSLLQQVKPKIIIVEEAAEVLESHIITTLNENCQQLILIGDHKQLRPSPTVYDLAKRYKLDVSLFERLIRNGLPCVTLSEQHRMRPEISVLMRHEHLYPHLKDHISVKSYEKINGIESSIFFIDHKEIEQQSQESTSYFNKYEAQYLAALCRYLIQQGYTAEQITVLSPYMGQVITLRKEMPKPEFDGVRITAVDNFQGEENDIILLSLVRSSNYDEHFSKRNPIGFLGIENRVCVALSRAKKGLYVMGNFLLLSESNEMWKYMVDLMRNSNKLKTSITLHCQNHSDSAVVAAKPEDFNEAPEGGCKRTCDFPLKCGHTCRKYCHILDKEHEVYKCLKPCARVNACGHSCKKKCFEDCEPCEQLVKKDIPMCGHQELMKCYLDPTEWFCKSNCNVLLPCGHECAQRCGGCVKSGLHRDHCERKVERKWPCGHLVTAKCCNGPDTVACPQPCGVELNCKHKCSGTCGECLEGRLHKSCTSTCNKILPCGHHCSHNCSEICPPCNRPCDWICLHGVKCKNKCFEECRKCVEDCAVKCKHKKCGKACHEQCENFKCDESCNLTLDCGHPCAGLCDEKCPKLCPVCEPEKFNNPMDKVILLKDCKCIVSVSELDKHMEQTLKYSSLKSEPLFRCPNSKCNKQIVKPAKRYINYIKQRRWLIFNRYLVLAGTSEERKKESRRLQDKVKQLLKIGLTEDEAKHLEINIKDDRFGSLHNSSRTIQIMEALLKLCQEIVTERRNINNKNVTIVAMQVEKVRKTLMVKRKSVTTQFWNEAEQEVKELRTWLYGKDDIRNSPSAFLIKDSKVHFTEKRNEATGGETQTDECKVTNEMKSRPSGELQSALDDFDEILNEIQSTSDEIVVASDEID